MFAVLRHLADPDQVLGLGQTTTIILQVEHGRGRHSQELHVDDFNQMLLVGESSLLG